MKTMSIFGMGGGGGSSKVTKPTAAPPVPTRRDALKALPPPIGSTTTRTLNSVKNPYDITPGAAYKGRSYAASLLAAG